MDAINEKFPRKASEIIRNLVRHFVITQLPKEPEE